MTDVTINNQNRGGPGLKSPEVGPGCGLHKNMVSNGTLLDFSGAAATEYVLTATTACTIQRIVLTVNEVVAAAATLNCGLIRGATTTANYFGTLTTAAAVAAGTQVDFTISVAAVLAGDTITLNSAGSSGGTGTGWLTVEYTIDDEHN